MATVDVQGRQPMYRVQPYFKIKKIKLPDCMYLLHPIHSPAYWKALEEDGKINLDYVEKRQDDLFAELRQLNDKVAALSEKLGVDPEAILQQPPSVIDVAVSCPVSQSPAVLVAIYRYVSQIVPTSHYCFKHSSAVNTSPVNIFTGGNPATSPPRLKITLIWKSEDHCPKVKMMVSPHDQVPIEGMGNIARYICREFCSDVYEDLGPEKASIIDSWIDRFYQAFLFGNAKEKASVIRNFNASLGSNQWVIGDQFSLADIVCYCVLCEAKGLKLTNNILRWLKNCMGNPLFTNLPGCDPPTIE